MTVWDKKDLAQQPIPKLHIVMMDCGNRLRDLAAKTEYSTLDQFQEISSMLGENAVCTILAQNEYSDAYDFRQRLEASEAFMKDMLTIIHINAGTHNDYGI